MSILVNSEELKTNMQNDLLSSHSMEQFFNVKVPPQEKQPFISTTAIVSCLYERKQPVFIDVDTQEKSGVNFGGLNSQLWCLFCGRQYAERCPLHGLSYASRKDNCFHTSKAMRSLPAEVSLCRSSVPGAEFGVCTRRHIPAGTWIGPFEGKRVQPDDVKAGMDTSFMWEIFEGNKLMYFIDGSDLESSSWMRFIQCARSKHEQNLFAFQYRGNVYYRSFKDIAVGEELLVWYDDKYLQHFGIPTGLQEMCFVTDHGDVWLTGTVQSVEQKSKPPFREAGIPLTRSSSTDSRLSDQRSSPVSDLESDVSDPNSPVPFAKSPLGEMTSWRCQQCHKTFSQRVALQLHVCPCRPAKPYQCGQCSLAFSNSSLLRAHVISHSSEKPFKCGFCSRAFVGATTLNNHIRSHMGQKPFGCEKCGKTFSQPGLLARHTRNPRECKGYVSPSSMIA